MACNDTDHGMSQRNLDMQMTTSATELESNKTKKLLLLSKIIKKNNNFFSHYDGRPFFAFVLQKSFNN